MSEQLAAAAQEVADKHATFAKRASKVEESLEDDAAAYPRGITRGDPGIKRSP